MAYDQICWEFLIDEDPSYPMLPLYLNNPEHKEYEIFENFKLDTGFAGTIGINDDIIKRLQLDQIGKTPVSTPIGVKNIPYYHLYIRNHEWDLLESLILAIKTPRPLIGRATLNRKKFFLDFEQSLFCYLKEKNP